MTKFDAKELLSVIRQKWENIFSDILQLKELMQKKPEKVKQIQKELQWLFDNINLIIADMTNELSDNERVLLAKIQTSVNRSLQLLKK